MQETTTDTPQKKYFVLPKRFLSFCTTRLRKPQTLRGRLALLNAFVIVVILSILGLIVYQTISYVLIQSLDDHLYAQANKLQSQTEGVFQQSYPPTFFQHLVRSGSINEFTTNSLSIKLFDKDTSRLIALSPFLNSIALPLNHGDFEAAAHGQHILTSSIDKQGIEVHTLLLPLYDKYHHIVVIAQISQSLQVVKQVQDILSSVIILRSLLAACIASAFIFWVTSYELRPLKLLSNSMHTLSIQQLHTRLQTGKTVHEIQLLTDAFNRMVERLEASFALQRNFVSDVSHELRTPLTAIQGLIDVVLLDTTLKEEDRRDLQQVSSEIKRLTRLVANLLMTTRAEAGALPQPFHNGIQFVELDLLLIEVARQLRFFKPDSTLEIHQLEQLRVPGDGDLLKQLLVNLVENALTHAGSRSHCTVTLALTSSHAVPPLRAPKAITPTPQDWAILSVCDNGPGIDPNDLPHIFERYYRAKQANKRSKLGSGLGLSIAQLIAEAHHGHITVASEPTQGACFSVWLPLFAPDTLNISSPYNEQ